jgi:hypothetical protein
LVHLKKVTSPMPWLSWHGVGGRGCRGPSASTPWPAILFDPEYFPSVGLIDTVVNIDHLRPYKRRPPQLGSSEEGDQPDASVGLIDTVVNIDHLRPYKRRPPQLGSSEEGDQPDALAIVARGGR